MTSSINLLTIPSIGIETKGYWTGPFIESTAGFSGKAFAIGGGVGLFKEGLATTWHTPLADMSIYGEVSPGLEGSVKVGATTEITTPLYKIGVSFGPPTPLPEGPDLIDQAISGLYYAYTPAVFPSFDTGENLYKYGMVHGQIR